MPALERRHLYQRAALWRATGGYDARGQPTIAATPTDVFCRWNDTRSDQLDPKGNTITVDATVIVNVDIPVDSWIWLAPLITSPATEQWNASGSGLDDGKLCAVKTVVKTPDIRARAFQRQIGVLRLHKKGAD